MRRHSPVSLVADEKRGSTITLKAVNELIQSLESAAEVCEDYAIRYISSGPAPKEGLHPGDKLYRHAQPAPSRDQVRREHAEWSQATFGNVGPIGPLKHLSKEALEAVAEPDDLSEWADMQFLLWDAQRRAGITDEQITQAMIEKLVVNKQREWPEPKDEEPRLHIKEQPAPVVPPMQHWEELCRQYPDMSIRDAIIRAAWWNHCRAAMLQAGNSPVIPEGYVMVPKEPTNEMLAAAKEWTGLTSTAEAVYIKMLEAATQPQNEPQNIPEIIPQWIPVSERMPERGDYLVTDGRDFDVQPFDGEQFIPGFVWEDAITHWMPLPAAPQEVKGE
nr:dATP/dGTP pyrophosphohydrolase domain-containing protein [Klebsiella pneumoniae]